MISNSVLDRSRVEIKLGQYGTAPATALLDPSILPRVQEYRRLASAQMYPLDRSDISRKIPNAQYHVSRKVDGEFTVALFRDGEVLTINPGGTVRVGMPWQEEAVKRLRDAKIREAMIVGELYVHHADGRRERVHDVTSLVRQPDSTTDLERLRFAAFDLISIDDEACKIGFEQNWPLLQKIFGSGQSVTCVESVIAKSAKEIEAQYHKWVEQENSEGLVVRSDTVGNFKIKPRHSLDAAVIGFTESSEDRQGMMHDLLLAIARTDGAMQVLCRVGGGFSEDQRRDILSDLKDMVVESEYAEVNSDHVAYQMVKPKWVVEINFLDLISQTTRGGPVNRMVLNWNRNRSTYEVIRRLPLCSVISPQFQRIREDKSVNASDVRIAQVADMVEIPMADKDATRMKLPKSTLLRREVYTKTLKGELMVRKFLMWKTNKETESDEFPGYVIHYTDFSPNRKNPLDRDLRITNSHDQILHQWEKMKDANIKKGWSPVGKEDPAAIAEKVIQPKTSKIRASSSSSDSNSKTAPTEKTQEPVTKKKKPAADQTKIKANANANANAKIKANADEQPAKKAQVVKKSTKPSTKKTTPKKGTIKKPSTKKTTPKKGTIKKPTTKKPTTKKPTTKKPTTKKPTTKKPTTKKPTTKKPTTKKPTTKKPTSRSTGKKAAKKKPR